MEEWKCVLLVVSPNWTMCLQVVTAGMPMHGGVMMQQMPVVYSAQAPAPMQQVGRVRLSVSPTRSLSHSLPTVSHSLISLQLYLTGASGQRVVAHPLIHYQQVTLLFYMFSNL